MDNVEENENNFYTNLAYGGDPNTKTNITKLISDFTIIDPTSTPVPPITNTPTPITPTSDPSKNYFMMLDVDVPSDYVIGYRDFSSSSSEIIELTTLTMEIQGKYFEYQIYV